jgi:hypothetical protein
MTAVDCPAQPPPRLNIVSPCALFFIYQLKRAMEAAKMSVVKDDRSTSMSQVYNPESEIIAEVERLELEARDARRSIERVKSPEDRRVLNRQLGEIKDRIDYLRKRLP